MGSNQVNDGTLPAMLMRVAVKAGLLGFLAVLALSADATVLLRVGYAYDWESNTLLYTENHREVYDGDRVIRSTVTYKNADGRPFAEKKIDFANSRAMPDFKLTNHLTGHREGSHQIGRKRTVDFRKTAEKKLKTKRISAPSTAIIDAGFDRFVEDHWDQLASGKPVVVPFLVPSLFTFLDFRVTRLDDKTRSGRKTLVFRIEPAQFLVRALANHPIDVTYDAEKRILMGFEGISNMRDTKGKNFRVRINFPMKERAVIKVTSARTPH